MGCILAGCEIVPQAAMTLCPDPNEIRDGFEAAVTRLRGTVSDCYQCDEHLFMRAHLPQGKEVRPKDFIGHGVALRTRGHQVVVHPYSFRQICRNGAIHIGNIASRVIDRLPPPGGFAVLDEIRLAVRTCATNDAFETNLLEMEQMLAKEAMEFLHIASMATEIGDSAVFLQIFDRFIDERDLSAFGLMNAITAQARDEPDPERRWNLEALGGGLLARLQSGPPQLRPGESQGQPRHVRDPEIEATC